MPLAVRALRAQYAAAAVVDCSVLCSSYALCLMILHSYAPVDAGMWQGFLQQVGSVRSSGGRTQECSLDRHASFVSRHVCSADASVSCAMLQLEHQIQLQ
jgi:hypothetical protein